MILNSETIQTDAPFDEQFGVLARRTLPDGLRALLDTQPGQRLYAVFDGTLIPGFDSPDQASGQQCACLFEGAGAKDLAHCAPYLVELDPDGAFTRRLFTQGTQGAGLWDTKWGIVIRSGGDFAALRRHLRRFTKIKGADGRFFFLRFYSPDTMSVVLAELADDPARLQRWFSHQSNDIVSAYLIPDFQTGAFSVQTLRQPGPWAAEPVPFRLDAEYDRILRVIRVNLVLRRIGAAVEQSVGLPAGMARARYDALIRASVEAAQAAGVISERALGYVAAAAVLCDIAPTKAQMQASFAHPGRPAVELQDARRMFESAKAMAHA